MILNPVCDRSHTVDFAAKMLVSSGSEGATILPPGIKRLNSSVKDTKIEEPEPQPGPSSSAAGSSHENQKKGSLISQP
jgi:hypothetical protein